MVGATSSSQKDNNGDASSLIISAAMFIVTAVVACQWTTNDDNDNDNDDRRQQYQFRRLYDRLSYENLRSTTQQPPKKVSSEGFPTQLLSPHHPDCDYPTFHPKNKNWRHFERCSSNSRESRSLPTTTQLPTTEQKQLPSPPRLPSLEDDNDDGEEEEDFVWTSHPSSSNTKQEKNCNEEEEQIKGSMMMMEVPTAGSNLEVPPSIPKPAPSLLTRMLSGGDNNNSSDDNNIIDNNNNNNNNRWIRRDYNAKIMPEKLIMIRHGQSMGNRNELLYSTTPDNAMPLTDLGWEQAKEAGRILRNKILLCGGRRRVHFIVSPYTRTVETFHGIVSAWCDPQKELSHITDREERVKAWYGRLMEMGLTWNEDSRIREQDFGNYQDPKTIQIAKNERHRFGAFYYRFPHGESASDVFDRVSTFLDSLWRSFDNDADANDRYYVLVTHGISIRVLLARYFRYTIEQFHMLSNPRNCEMVILNHSGDGRLELSGRCQLEMDEDETKVIGHKFHKRLRVIPESARRKVKIRISPNDN